MLYLLDTVYISSSLKFGYDRVDAKVDEIAGAVARLLTLELCHFSLL